MKTTRQIMGMPVTIDCPDVTNTALIKKVFDFFRRIDQTYSPYIETSNVGKINRGELDAADYSDELKEILVIADQTKQETKGYFDVWHNGTFDPSGIVKGWAIQKAAAMLDSFTQNYYLEAGGDIQVRGVSGHKQPWRIGIRNPFERTENIAVVALDNAAIATSGTAIRGQHIYNSHGQAPTGTVSLSVIGGRIVDADRYATAAFAMGLAGINFIQSLDGFEGYMVDDQKLATQTSGWHLYEVSA